ncbi:DUF2922 domain-containing protein [Peptococcaceae bacterium 1198_IL3148]
MASTLEMIFVSSSGNKVTLRVAEPLETLTAQDVKSAMDTIVAKNVFTSNGGDLVAVADARIVSREVTNLDIL